jgi:superfamily II DNA or RNA helicase
MKVTPEYIDNLVKFNVFDQKWKYTMDATDMCSLQVKGTAKVFNLLQENGLALLADEVGMGKTIQSLSVMAALWNQKPDAKILVLVPREEIGRNWEKEYQNFVRHHYRHPDEIVKSMAGQVPVKKMIQTGNMYQLTKEIQQGWGQLFVAKISSFSALMVADRSIERLEKLGIKELENAKSLSKNPDITFNNELMRLLRTEIMDHAKDDEPYFDLVIIDEAHYLRRREGSSLKVNSASLFFGKPDESNFRPITKKVLLLTATPNHSSAKDIQNIVAYFTNQFNGVPYQKILEKICVRRLRRLSKKGLNKYNYRREMASESNFENDPLSESFFALYQHQLAKELFKKKKSGGQGANRMMRYLEGVEFIPTEKQVKIEPIIDPKEELLLQTSSDFTTGSDTQILLDISTKYFEVFKTNPRHPKYDKLVTDLSQKEQNEKGVVFVRRIASVYEIAKRIIEFEDELLYKTYKKAFLSDKIPFSELDRRTFHQAKGNFSKMEEENEFDEDHREFTKGEITGKIPQSKILNLFKIIKQDAIPATDASNFRLKFSHSKPTIFSLFFSVGADYFAAPYNNLTSHRFEVGSRYLENFYFSALIHRTSKIDDIGMSKDILSQLLTKQPLGDPSVVDTPIHTLLTIFFQVLSDDSDEALMVSSFEKLNFCEREALANFLEKGTLLASRAVAWLYDVYLRCETTSFNTPLKHYQAFCELVKKELKQQRLYQQIKDSILHFKTIYSKVFSINSNSMLLTENWDSFNNAQPIYPYNADNSNQKVLRCFNTPFYPDFLVATSVLQEGVNLQYFCKTIYHYGMAWTPGDNEQRIGRIDRMFGKIERELEGNSSANLLIYYPFLKNSIDEDQLKRFIKRKYHEERIIDKGAITENVEGFDFQEMDNDDWLQFLRSPIQNEIGDPYPTTNDDFSDLVNNYSKPSSTSLESYHQAIFHAITSLSKYNAQVYSIEQDGGYKLLIDPQLNARHQPVVIEILLDPIGTGIYGRSVFCIRMKTPLAPVSRYAKHFKTIFSLDENIQKIYSHGIKLCLDPSQRTGSIWGIYMAVDLPFFLSDIENNLLSQEEIQLAFEQLIQCADFVELNLLKGDLKKQDLNLPISNFETANQASLPRARSFSNLPVGWKVKDSHLLKEVFFDLNASDGEKNALVYNHTSFFVKAIWLNNGLKLEIAHPKIDAHVEELRVLEKHLEVFEKTLRFGI